MHPYVFQVYLINCFNYGDSRAPNSVLQSSLKFLFSVIYPKSLHLRGERREKLSTENKSQVYSGLIMKVKGKKEILLTEYNADAMQGSKRTFNIHKQMADSIKMQRICCTYIVL